MSNQATKINLLGMTRSAMEAFFESLDEKTFRAHQVMKWIYHFGVADFDEMTNIGKQTQAKLKEVAEIRFPEIVSDKISVDGTRKWVVRVESGSLVETVLIPESGRGTLCVSSQAGCSLDCSFCSTGKQGFNSDLTRAEIAGQVWLAAKAYNTLNPKTPRVVTNVVMMGMGEPLLNFDNVMDAMSIMMDDLGFGLSKRRVTLSTSGVVPGLEKMIGQTDVSLALSLHAPNDELRNELVPINKKYPIKLLLKTVQDYMDTLADKRVVTIEYTLIKGVNDHKQHARDLVELLRKTPCKINLIPFNPFNLSNYERSTDKAISNFRKILNEANYNVTVRTTRGDDIDAACGQLAGTISDKTSRSARHLANFTTQNALVIASDKLN